MPNKKVLLVDDSPVTLVVEEMVIKNRTPYDVLKARDGQEAVEKAVRERPDLILMDICMPCMDGFQACQEMRRREQTRNTPIILVTTRSEDGYLDRGFECGCNDYLTKPVDEGEMIAVLENYLGD